MNAITTTAAPASSFPAGTLMTAANLTPGARVAVELDTGNRASGTVQTVAADASCFVLNTSTGAALVATTSTRAIISLGAAEDVPAPSTVPTTDRETAEAEINMWIAANDIQVVDNITILD